MTSFLFSAAATPRQTGPGRAMLGLAAVPPIAPLPQAAGTTKKSPWPLATGIFCIHTSQTNTLSNTFYK